MIDFRIQTFLAVCSCLNYTKAAKQLHITQPAVTQHIQYLEQYYNCQLFFHEGHHITLSPAGELLLHSANAYRNDDMFLKEKIEAQKSHATTLKFGTTMTIGEFVIAKPLSHFIKSHPDADIHMTIANTSELLRQLGSGKIHFALVEGYYDSAAYASMPYSTENFIAVCSGSHPIALKHEPVSISDLLSERILVREPGSGTREILERNLSTHNIQIDQFKHVTEVSGMHTIISLVEDNCGITFLYQTAVTNELANGTLVQIPLTDFAVTHDFTFLWNKDSIFQDEYIKICSQLG